MNIVNNYRRFIIIISYGYRSFDLSKELLGLDRDTRKLAIQIYSTLLDAWDREFYMNLRPRGIQETINSYTAIALMPGNPDATRDEMLNAFTSKYNKFQQLVTLESPRGCSIAVAWCMSDPEDGPSVQALMLTHPFQADAFHETAFDGTAESLGLEIAYFDESTEETVMDRWSHTAEAIMFHADNRCAAGNMRFIRTENTMFPKAEIKPKPIVPRFTDEPVDA